MCDGELDFILNIHVRCTWFRLSTIIPFCCCSVTQSCLTLCDPMDYGTAGFPVLHHLRKLAQTHVHWVSDAIQPSHPLTPPSPALKSLPASGFFSMSPLFTWGGQSTGVSVLPMNFQGWFPLGLTGLIYLLFKGLSRVFSSTTVQKHQFFSVIQESWSQRLLLGNST